LERYRLKAAASGYYVMANRLKDQIGELESASPKSRRTEADHGEPV
jgi:hypothetical protein